RRARERAAVLRLRRVALRRVRLVHRDRVGNRKRRILGAVERNRVLDDRLVIVGFGAVTDRVTALARALIPDAVVVAGGQRRRDDVVVAGGRDGGERGAVARDRGGGVSRLVDAELGARLGDAGRVVHRLPRTRIRRRHRDGGIERRHRDREHFGDRVA